MDNLAAIVVDGLVTASWLFLLSVGLSVIYGVLRILNLAHGSLYAIGAFAGAILATDYLQQSSSLWGTLLTLIVAALIVAVIGGPLIERGLLRWIYGRDPMLQLLATYALFLILEGLQQAVWGAQSFAAYGPYGAFGLFTVAGIPYPRYDILLLAVAAAAGVLLWLFLNRSHFGRLIMAATHDPEMSRAMGINLTHVYVVTFTIGVFLAALGGSFAAPTITVVPGFSVDTTVIAFAVVVIGGLGSIGGAALGALIVGLAQAAAIQFVPDLELFVIYLVMTLVLLIRPQGLFAHPAVRRI